MYKALAQCLSYSKHCVWASPHFFYREIKWIRYKLFVCGQKAFSGSGSVIRRPAASISPGNLLEMKILQPTWIRHSRGRAQQCGSDKPPWFWCPLTSESSKWEKPGPPVWRDIGADGEGDWLDHSSGERVAA